MILEAWLAIGSVIVAAVSIWIVRRERENSETEDVEAALTRRLEADLDNELSGAQEGAWRL